MLRLLLATISLHQKCGRSPFQRPVTAACVESRDVWEILDVPNVSDSLDKQRPQPGYNRFERLLPMWTEFCHAHRVLFGYCRWLTEMVGLGEADQAYADPKTLDKSRSRRMRCRPSAAC